MWLAVVVVGEKKKCVLRDPAGYLAYGRYQVPAVCIPRS